MCNQIVIEQTFKVNHCCRCCYFSVCLQGSVLAFHEHGLQGRSLHSGKVKGLDVIKSMLAMETIVDGTLFMGNFLEWNSPF